MPGQANAITEQVAGFLENRQVIGVLGIGALLFFSAMTFSVLQSAIATIFHRRVKPTPPARRSSRRSFPTCS